MSDMIYKLYGQAATNTNDVAHLDIQQAGMIDGVYLDFSIITSTPANNTGAELELSFAATNYLHTSDTRAPIASLAMFQGFNTSGLAVVGRNMYIPFPRGMAVAVMDRLYMHLFNFAGTISAQAWAYIYVSVSGAAMRSMAPVGAPFRRRR